MSEDDLYMWQDLLDDVAAGRTQSLRCPFCSNGAVQVTQTGGEGRPQRTRLECGACRRFIEGKMGQD
jgi:hypothetical protein